MATDYADDIVLLANTSAKAESLLHSLKLAIGDTDLYMNVKCVFIKKEPSPL